MTCRRCGYVHVFDPRQRLHLSDRRVMNAARRLGSGDRTYTPFQVLASLAAGRRLIRWTLAPSADTTDAAIAGIHELATRFPLVFEHLLVERGFDCGPAPAWPESDLFDYGAERLLVVDDDVLVDLLVRREVHTSARVIIVSGVGSGYPSEVVGRARALLERRPLLPVFVLHATANPRFDIDGVTSRLFGRPARATDLGLSPAAPRNVPELRWARRLPSVPVDALPSAWFTVDLVEALTTGVPLETLERRRRRDGWDASSGDYG